MREGYLTTECVKNIVNEFFGDDKEYFDPLLDEAIRNYLRFMLISTEIPPYDAFVTSKSYEDSVRYLIELKGNMLSIMSHTFSKHLALNSKCSKNCWDIHMLFPEEVRAIVEKEVYMMFNNKQKCDKFKDIFNRYNPDAA